MLVMEKEEYLTHESMLEIAEQRERENEEATKPKSLGTSLEQWWDSEAHKQLQEESEATVQRALEKYSMLSEDDKYDLVQAICHIMCEAEKKGVSHRGLMDELGIYPILLLDDIFDRLDPTRVKQLLEMLTKGDFGQIFLTDTHEKRVSELLEKLEIDESKLFRIEDAKIIG
jgi:hypothetical protein